VNTPRVVVGGALDPDTDLYIERTADHVLRGHIEAGRSCLVIGSRSMGKTSLASMVGRQLEHRAAHPFRVAIGDFDRDKVGSKDDLTHDERVRRILGGVWRSLGHRGHERGADPTSAPTLLEGLVQMADVDVTRPLLVVFDEFDRLAAAGDSGIEVVREVRGVLQELRRERQLRERLVLCILSVRGGHELFEGRVEDPSIGLELPTELIRLGPFEITDATRMALANGLVGYDAGNPDNLARVLLEASGGYPQLTMDLLRRTTETKTKYGPDYQRFLHDQVAWFKHKADPLRRRFFEVIAGFIQEDPRLGARALRVYREILVAARDATEEIEFDWADPAHRLLVVAGLAREGEGKLRAFSPFLADYFDVRWADDLRIDLESQRSVSGGQQAKRDRKSERKLCVLVTGGTIGMVERNGRVRPPDSGQELSDEYAEVNDLFDVKWEALADLDSANVGPSHWGTFARAIAERREQYDGIVVAHGTDTLAFTASAVAYALGDKLDVPVVFTGSQTTVDTVYGDARTNLIRACLVASSPKERPSQLPEVVISFGEYVFRAVRATKRDDRRYDAFESPAYPPLGTIGEEVSLYDAMIRKVPSLTPGLRTRLELRDTFVPGILTVSQTPAMYPDYYRAALAHSERPVRGLVIQSLGAGNIPTEGDHNLVPLIEDACERGIPVVLAGQYPIHPANLGKYAPPRKALAAGAIPIANMTTAALVAKLSWVLAQLSGLSGDRLNAQVRQLLLQNLVGEIDDRDSAELASIDPVAIRREDEETWDGEETTALD